MKTECVPISITMSDGTLTIMHFVIRERKPDGTIRWEKPPTTENVDKEVKKAFGNIPTYSVKLPTEEGVDPQVKRIPSNPTGNHAVSWRQITYDDVPPDRFYRNAWRDDGKKIYHDMDHVRKLHLEHLRRERVPILEQKDRDWMRAMGQGKMEDVKRIEEDRQTLRDLPTTILKELEKAKTPEEVKKIGIDRLK
jgi:hypothetical protein